MTKESYWKLMDLFREKSGNDLNFFHAFGHEQISKLDQKERIEFNTDEKTLIDSLFKTETKSTLGGG